MSEEGVMSVEMEPPGSLVDLFEPRDWPGQMGLWRVALQIPEPPKYSAGGIAMPEEFLDDYKYATFIGNVRAMGELCFKAKTNGGIDLADDPGFKIGDWVMVSKHTGQKFRMVDGTLWIIFTDTQYISVVYQPELFDCMAIG